MKVAIFGNGGREGGTKIPKLLFFGSKWGKIPIFDIGGFGGK